MRTKYKLVDSDGDEFHDLKPYIDHPVEVVSVQFWPNSDPDDPSEDTMVVTLRYLHEISDEEQKERIKLAGYLAKLLPLIRLKD